MIVRRASPEDTDAIGRVAEATWRVDYPEVLNRENTAEVADDWYRESTMLSAIEREDAMVLVASLDAEVVGFAHAYVGEWRGDLLRLYVAPGYRGREVGTELLERSVEELFEAGAGEVGAMVLAANDRGRAFYEAAGFELADESAETVIDGDRYRECSYRLDEAAWAGGQD